MRAWRVHEHGDPEAVLHLEDVDPLVPGPGRVVVAVAAAALNFADILVCQGRYQEHPPLPFTPGMEAAGTVTAVGDGVDRALVGRRFAVLPSAPHGGLADQCEAEPAALYPIPDGMGDRAAAALVVTYQTAWFGLVRRAGLQAGETLLVHAGAGGTGSAAIQVGRALGAHVIATAGGADKVAICTSLGADLALDYRETDFVDAVNDATGGRGADVVYDTVGGDTFDRSRKCIAWEGRIVVVGFAGGRIPEVPANHLLVKNYSVVGVYWGSYRARAPELVTRAHDQLVAWHADGLVDPLVMAVHPLEQVPAALASLGSRATYGKLVIRP
jgi:NADPH2:quinone reductase